MNVVYKVYWSQISATEEQSICNFKDFDKEQMTLALNFMEYLRSIDNVRFISLSVEHPDSVGKQGVDVTGPDYNWKKRRI